jgi:hypothetical protein
MGDRLNCSYCSEVIGIYEPMITLSEGDVRETSLAVDPNGGVRANHCYHRACYFLKRDNGESSKCG